MTTKSEFAELARLMERYPEELPAERNDDQPRATLEIGNREWPIIIEALRIAAAT